MSSIKNNVPAQLKNVDRLSKLLDSQFRIPGTTTRFGVDFIIGLVPFAGDVISFLFSSSLVMAMVKYGVSGQVVGRMLLNIFLDTTVGSIPIIGDVFDLYYKANRRNYHLLEKHYRDGAYPGSIWRVLVPTLIALAVLFALLLWVIAKIIAFTWGLLN